MPQSNAIPVESTSDTQGLPPLSGLSRIVAVVVGAVMVLAAVGAIGAVLIAADQPYWMVVGFEVVVVVAGVIAVLTSRGKFRDGPGMALLSVAGVLFVAGVLGYISTRATQGVALNGRTFSMKPWALLHVAAAIVVGVAAAYEVLRRDRRSLYYLSRAAMAGVALAGLSAVSWVQYRKLNPPVYAPVDFPPAIPVVPPAAPSGILAGLPSWLVWTAGCVAAVAALVLFCACAHCLIRAFEMGRPRHSQGATSS